MRVGENERADWFVGSMVVAAEGIYAAHRTRDVHAALAHSPAGERNGSGSDQSEEEPGREIWEDVDHSA
jgi:hypothetical protein